MTKDKLDFKKVLLLLVTAIFMTLLACLLVLVTNPAPTFTPFTATAQIALDPPTPTPPSRPSRNNGGPCDPNNLPPSPSTRNAGINANPPKAQVTVTISKSVHPETAAHIEAAQQAGHPRYLTIDRDDTRVNMRREQATSVCPIVSGFERDEYPPAMFREGGQGASVRYVQPGDNRGAGARIGRLLQSYSNGTIVEIVVVP